MIENKSDYRKQKLRNKELTKLRSSGG